MKNRIRQIEKRVRELKKQLLPGKLPELLVFVLEDGPSAVIEKRLIWDDRKKSYEVFGVICVPVDATAEELQKVRAEYDRMEPEKSEN